MLWKLIFEQYMKVSWIFLANIVARATVLPIPASATKRYVKRERVLSQELLMMSHTSANIVQKNSIIKWH